MAVTRESDATYFIPTENEWYKAAYHKNDGVTGNYFHYPTGIDTWPSNDLLTPDPGNNANFYDGSYTIGSPYYMTVVGEFENSESPYGTFDQGGTGGPAYEDGSVGFRAASVPEPGSITLLLFGAVGLLTYAWRRHRR